MDSILNLTSIDIYGANSEQLYEWLEEIEMLLGGDGEVDSLEETTQLNDIEEMIEDELRMRGA